MASRPRPFSSGEAPRGRATRNSPDTAHFSLAPPDASAYIAPHAGGDARTSGGAIAQLGERLNGIQEVRGSTPLGSTIDISL